ncbi:MAG: hypothetical protein Q8L27_03425 [archaeon]|nr:hypothetical protein [archaeon]
MAQAYDYSKERKRYLKIIHSKSDELSQMLGMERINFGLELKPSAPDFSNWIDKNANSATIAQAKQIRRKNGPRQAIHQIQCFYLGIPERFIFHEVGHGYYEQQNSDKPVKAILNELREKSGFSVSDFCRANVNLGVLAEYLNYNLFERVTAEFFPSILETGYFNPAGMSINASGFPGETDSQLFKRPKLEYELDARGPVKFEEYTEDKIEQNFRDMTIFLAEFYEDFELGSEITVFRTEGGFSFNKRKPRIMDTEELLKNIIYTPRTELVKKLRNYQDRIYNLVNSAIPKPLEGESKST